MSFLEPMDSQASTETLTELVSDQEFWPAPGMRKGIPRGAVIELFGENHQEWCWEFLRYNPDLRIFWDLKKNSSGQGNLFKTVAEDKRITFATLKNLIAVTLRHVIQSQKYEIILTQNSFLDLRIFQALQFFVKKARSTLFVMSSDKKNTPASVSLQLHVTKNQRGEWQVMQNIYQPHPNQI